MKYRVITKNNIEVSIMLREVIQHETNVSYVILTNKEEVILNDIKMLDQSLISLGIQVKKYMVDNHIGE